MKSSCCEISSSILLEVRGFLTRKFKKVPSLTKYLFDNYIEEYGKNCPACGRSLVATGTSADISTPPNSAGVSGICKECGGTGSLYGLVCGKCVGTGKQERNNDAKVLQKIAENQSKLEVIRSKHKRKTPGLEGSGDASLEVPSKS